MIYIFLARKLKEKEKTKQKEKKKLFTEEECSHGVVSKKITDAFWRRNMCQKAGI
jgi:hypothetical protein